MQTNAVTHPANAIAAVLLVIVFRAGMPAQESVPAASRYGAFAFADGDGKRLLVTPGIPEPARLHTALCTGGTGFPVRFERHSSGHDARQISRNFDKLPGDMFAITRGEVEPGETCFLAADGLVSSALILPMERPAGRRGCEADRRSRIAFLRGRQVVNCWPIARVASSKDLVFLEFARRDKDALASVLLIDADRIVFADYPAVFRGQGQDLWRVDDGGVLSPEGMQPVFLLQQGTLYTLGLEWSGTEGVSLAVFVSNGDRFNRVINDYWYQAPM